MAPMCQYFSGDEVSPIVNSIALGKAMWSTVTWSFYRSIEQCYGRFLLF